MAFDSGAQTVTIKGKWQGPDGKPATGYVEITLDAPTSDKDTNVDVSYTIVKNKYALDASGSISVPYIVTDQTVNTSLARSVSVSIREVFDGAKVNKWSTVVTDHGGGIFNLSQASPIEVRPMNQYVLLGTFSTAMNAKADRVVPNDSTLVQPTANALARRTDTGQLKGTTPVAADDYVIKSYADAVGTSAVTANVPIKRDAAGRAQVNAPSAGNDIANKTYVDGVGTNVSTASTIMRRDASGRAQVADPSAVNDIASKQYVDNKIIASTPATATAAGTKGQIAYDNSYLYVCTATNTWKRVALATW